MKIDDKLTVHSGATEPLAPPAPAGAGPASKTGTPAPQTDQLTLSPEARLLQAAAADAAAGDPAVRADVVARMRELLNQGAIGDDASRLAEALIDDVLKNK